MNVLFWQKKAPLPDPDEFIFLSDTDGRDHLIRKGAIIKVAVTKAGAVWLTLLSGLEIFLSTEHSVADVMYKLR